MCVFVCVCVCVRTVQVFATPPNVTLARASHVQGGHPLAGQPPRFKSLQSHVTRDMDAGRGEK